MESAWKKAEKTLKDKAKRILSNSNKSQKRSEASILILFAGIAAEGPDAVIGHLATNKYPESFLKVASIEVYGLALRRENLGSTRNLSAPIQSGWHSGGDDLGQPIHRATILEAVELYKISLAFQNNDYWAHSLGLLLERVGDFEQAVQVFESIRGSYKQYAPPHIKRCRNKALGTYDAESGICESFEKVTDAFDKAGQDGQVVDMIKGLMMSKVKKRKKSNRNNKPFSDADNLPLEDKNLDAAADIAQEFAELLVESQFEKAAELVTFNLGLSASDLKEEYEGMTIYGDEPDSGPFEVMVTQCSSDMPHMGAEDVAWVYVSISGMEFNEAITVIISNEKGAFRISDLEWGRP